MIPKTKEKRCDAYMEMCNNFSVKESIQCFLGHPTTKTQSFNDRATGICPKIHKLN